MKDSIESPASNRSTSFESPSGSDANGGIINKVRDTAASQLTNQKNRATEGLGTVAAAVRQSGQQLRDQQHDTIADYAEQAAQQIDRLSQRLRNKDIGELMNDAQRLARSQPALFIGGAFAVGLLGARFFKSSSRSTSEHSSREWNGPGYAGGRGYAGAGYTGSAGGGYTGSAGADYSSSAGASGSSGSEFKGYAQAGGQQVMPHTSDRAHDRTSVPASVEPAVPDVVGSEGGTAPNLPPESRSSRTARK